MATVIYKGKKKKKIEKKSENFNYLSVSACIRLYPSVSACIRLYPPLSVFRHLPVAGFAWICIDLLRFAQICIGLQFSGARVPTRWRFWAILAVSWMILAILGVKMAYFNIFHSLWFQKLLIWNLGKFDKFLTHQLSILAVSRAILVI